MHKFVEGLPRVAAPLRRAPGGCWADTPAAVLPCCAATQHGGMF